MFNSIFDELKKVKYFKEIANRFHQSYNVKYFNVGTFSFQKIFAKLKFSPFISEKIPSFVCLVLKNENKFILKL